MRSSLSCESCRRSKVKCINSGVAPCQRCQKSRFTGCALSRPARAAAKANRGRISRIRSIASSREVNGSNSPPREDLASPGQTATDAAPKEVPRPTPSASRGRQQNGRRRASGGKIDADAHISGLPNSIVLRTLQVFMNHFPELAILHLPTFVNDFQSVQSPESKALLGAVLAVTKAQLSVLPATWADELLSRDQYATYTRDMLSDLILQPPKIQVVQALLIIALHEWGSRDFHKAWVYCGVAIRIMQALHSLRVAPYPLDPTSERRHDAVSLAIETRTYWACFVMDCMVNSGTYSPPMLPMSEMEKLKIARPLSAVEFAFGPDLPPAAVGAHHSLTGQTTGMLDVTQSFEILVAGFDIWAQVMTFIFNDGRRAPGMCAPHNCPWVPTSPWSLSRVRLETWRAGQHLTLHYPKNSVAIHMTLGFGETFVYLNLLYHVSTLMLHREYVPFLPTLESEPQGPVDHPMLEASAPPGWWEDSAQELFGAAEHIGKILCEASECGVHLMTPFAGFCAFSAGYVNLYAYRFPRMNLNRSPGAEKCLNMCLDYLHEFSRVWRIADGWIKTIQHASLLYERASKDRKRYQGRTRADFDSLHQSVHEFRVVDRSEQHSREIAGAERAAMSAAAPQRARSTDTADLGVDTNFLLNQLLLEVTSNMDEQGAWSQWWPAFQQVDLPAGQPMADLP